MLLHLQWSGLIQQFFFNTSKLNILCSRFISLFRNNSLVYMIPFKIKK